MPGPQHVHRRPFVNFERVVCNRVNPYAMSKRPEDVTCPKCIATVRDASARMKVATRARMKELDEGGMV